MDEQNLAEQLASTDIHSSNSVAANAKKQDKCCLQNLIDKRHTEDTFHHQATPIDACNSNRCLGSLMQVPHSIPRHNGLKPKEQVIKEATEFLTEYYTSIRKVNTDEHLDRLGHVIEEIQEKGLYDLTEQELTFGARLSWRNASRCIGRIQWSNLQVFDARHATTPYEMNEAINTHLRYATNKGNLRSAMTLFPPRSDATHDFRVWNVQLVRYAGYERPDGSVIGDPSNVEFTQVCESYGWKGKGGMFDVLPLLLQANGEDPEIFEIPPELVLEVPISHPQYKWFEEFNLRWYALPAVSCMLLDIGGVEFPACPFNGWYMVTEIGARDFGDPNRYNLCKPVAQRLKLDTQSETSLWRDVAVIEMSRAVMYSFLKHGVTLVDHHTASNSFMQHLQNEQKYRGGCPADWVWIVPPISGSTTKVFHQEMLNYKIKPSLEYQADPWKTYRRKNRHKSSKDITFKSVANVVVLSTDLMHKALEKRIKATILFSTETGTSERYATVLKKLLDLKFDAKIICMENYDFHKLDYEALLFVVTSTFGNAEAPHNGREFGDMLDHRLQRIQAPHSNDGSTHGNQDSHHYANHINAKYSVFALGSRIYGNNFCAFGHHVDSVLNQLGGERIYPTGEGDELCGQEESFQSWASSVLEAACGTYGIPVEHESVTSVTMTTAPAWSEDCYRLSYEHSKPVLPLSQALSKIHSKKIDTLTVISVTNLQAATSKRSTILVKLKGNGSELVYNPGDHLSIFPGNSPELVNKLLDKLGEQESADIPCRMEYLDSENVWTTDDHIPPLFTLREAFSHFIDIASIPTPQLLQYLINQATDQGDKDKLKVLAKGSQEYENWKFNESPNIIDVMEQFPSLHLSSTLLLCKLPALKKRYYSISSCLGMFPNEVHITVAVVKYTTNSGKICHGVCSTWLDSLKEGAQVPYFIREAASFHMPSDRSVPIIMIGPGTGIAPFRSFWQQRVLDMKEANLHTQGNSAATLGPMVLYFGCRKSCTDDIYKTELQGYADVGVISELHTAYSRESNKPKQYVQDLMAQNYHDIIKMMLEEDGHIYVCGDVSMAAGVTHTIQKMLTEHVHLSQNEAINYIKDMQKSGRYHEDIFGITLRTAEVTQSSRKASIRRFQMIKKLNLRKLIFGSRH